jgi:hypothetical protein
VGEINCLVSCSYVAFSERSNGRCLQLLVTGSARLDLDRRKFPAVEAVQVLRRTGVDRAGELGVRLVSADSFLATLPV